MIGTAENRIHDGLAVLPDRDRAYCLEAVHELFCEGCRSEIVLQFTG